MGKLLDDKFNDYIKKIEDYSKECIKGLGINESSLENEIYYANGLGTDAIFLINEKICTFIVYYLDGKCAVKIYIFKESTLMQGVGYVKNNSSNSPITSSVVIKPREFGTKEDILEFLTLLYLKGDNAKKYHRTLEDISKTDVTTFEYNRIFKKISKNY